MRLTWLAQVLRDAGLTVFEAQGWQTRGRDTMNPKGVVAHHTASSAARSDAAMVKFLIAGRSDLPGPLCQLYLDRLGRYWVIASGKANHAGRGSWKGLVGNSSVIGIEAANDGIGEKWPKVQVDAYIQGTAALLRKLGRNAEWVCGHKEWAPNRKPDPHGIDMDDFRAKVATILGTPIPEPPSDTLTADEVQKLRQLIKSWESIGSNPTFPIYTIQHVRDARRNS